jgi:hypothetical protein
MTVVGWNLDVAQKSREKYKVRIENDDAANFPIGWQSHSLSQFDAETAGVTDTSKRPFVGTNGHSVSGRQMRDLLGNSRTFRRL